MRYSWSAARGFDADPEGPWVRVEVEGPAHLGRIVVFQWAEVMNDENV